MRQFIDELMALSESKLELLMDLARQSALDGVPDMAEVWRTERDSNPR